MMVRWVLFVVALAALLLAPTAQAGPMPVKPLQEWKGRVKDKELRKLAPKVGYVIDSKELAKLWQAWEIKGKMPQIDGAKQLILVATAPSSGLSLRATLDDKGDLKVGAQATADLRPDFVYHIVLISREGVKTINGKPVLKT
ncbi:MAG: hypothetical protein L0Z62_48460 [Gemmataceae bacterium]|nr:hypothetical protein [Gemmataceae bacterium]